MNKLTISDSEIQSIKKTIAQTKVKSGFKCESDTNHQLRTHHRGSVTMLAPQFGYLALRIKSTIPMSVHSLVAGCSLLWPDQMFGGWSKCFVLINIEPEQALAVNTVHNPFINRGVRKT